MKIDTLKAEQELQRIEREILTPGRSIGIGWMGVDVKFVACPKSRGGNLKRGKTWGRIIYSNYLADTPLTRAQTIDWITLPEKIRAGKIALLNKKVCAICGSEGIDKLFHDDWGYLRYQEHRMSICPSCIRNIYLKSHRPWENN
jgi:hypothetical protein